MNTIKIIAFVLLLVFIAAKPALQNHRCGQNKTPDLTKAEDLQALGTGRIVEKDNSILKNVKLIQVNEYWIIYEKNASSHDLMMEAIRRIEFPESKWGPLKIEFPNNKPETGYLTY